MHAVLDDFHLSWHRITDKQLIQLTRKVDTLYKASWVHGDLRLANIIFCFDNVTAINDWEWAGPVGTTRFPLNVNKGVFGRLASSHVSAGGLIPPDFDFLCLSDLLEDLKCFTAAAQAYVCNAQGVIDKLSCLDPDGEEDMRCILALLLVRPGTLDLCCLGLRFYNTRKTLSKGSRKGDGGSGAGGGSQTQAVSSASHSSGEGDFTRKNKKPKGGGGRSAGCR